ncbi:MAG TPA: ELM1/GtrOC1 family putative glycosyltransferase [Terriglobales bacterium]|nr:ELM1/GtrOC1 family putative glycosyltransferase [Terriglobales bacterium]
MIYNTKRLGTENIGLSRVDGTVDPQQGAIQPAVTGQMGAESTRPHIWALLSSRAGDNAQVEAVVDALGLPYEAKYFTNRPLAIHLNLLFGARYRWSVKSVQSGVAAPWPDLVIAAGTQSEPLCEQIKERAAQDGHNVRVIFLGRPWRDPRAYDLIVTTPQYRVPMAQNVLELQLPLHRVSRETADIAATRWQENIAHLPRPYTVVALGGNINRYTLDQQAARRLGAQLNQMTRLMGGSVLICSSYRTPAGIAGALAQHLEAPSYIYDWHASAAENPYLGFLGLADLCVITGDSMTMMAEACTLGRPVFIFDLGEGGYSMRPDGGSPLIRNAVTRNPVTLPRDGIWLRSFLRATLKHLKVRLIEKILPQRLIRDTDPIRAYLVASGQAAWLSDRFVPGNVRRGTAPAEIVAARVRQLLALPVEPPTAGAAMISGAPRGRATPAKGARHAI